MISSLLDNDFYKFTMQAAVRKLYPRTPVEYRLFPRRTPLPWNDTYVDIVRESMSAMGGLRLRNEEADWLKGLHVFENEYIDWLRGFALDPDAVRLRKTRGNELAVVVAGNWADVILWEVPLLAILSEAYYATIQTGWDLNLDAYHAKTLQKGRRLSEAGCPFSDFGTRRRRSRAVQECAIHAFAELGEGSTFSGTSNVNLARRYGVKPIGTVAHEWTMAIGGLHGAAEANRTACRQWLEVHGHIPLIALTDTYTVDLFIDNFDSDLAEAYDGVRHDSGDPFRFADRFERFYRDNGINPKGKTLVFSDSLDVDRAIEIQRHVDGRMKTAYGIGTHFMNDLGDRPLDIVIKLTEINHRPVAKLTDDPGKATGSGEAVEQAKEDVARRIGTVKQGPCSR